MRVSPVVMTSACWMQILILEVTTQKKTTDLVSSKESVLEVKA